MVVPVEGAGRRLRRAEMLCDTEQCRRKDTRARAMHGRAYLANARGREGASLTFLRHASIDMDGAGLGAQYITP